MKSGSCVRAALLAAAVVTFAAPAMGQATDPGKLSEAQQKAGGLTPDLIRLSVGIEHIDDIVADIKHGLDAASRSLKAA